MEHARPASGGAGAAGLLQVLVDAEGFTMFGWRRERMLSALPHATQTRPEVAYARAMLDELINAGQQEARVSWTSCC
jgi:hypothetical protein